MGLSLHFKAGLLASLRIEAVKGLRNLAIFVIRKFREWWREFRAAEAHQFKGAFQPPQVTGARETR